MLLQSDMFRSLHFLDPIVSPISARNSSVGTSSRNSGRGGSDSGNAFLIVSTKVAFSSVVGRSASSRDPEIRVASQTSDFDPEIDVLIILELCAESHV